MDNSNISASAAVEKSQQASSAYSNDQKIFESQRKRVDELNALILNAPQQAEQDKQLHRSDDDNDLRPQDKFERQAPPVQPPPPVKAPEVGPPVPRTDDATVVPVDGRGAAVALQEYLDKLRSSGDQEAFARAAKALGVEDHEEFNETVAAGHALNTFAAIDSSRLTFVDKDFNEVSTEQLSAVAKAQLVVKPPYEVPVDPEIKNPEVDLLNPHLRQHFKTDHVPDASEQLLKRQTEPATLKPVDQTANVQA